MRRRTPIGSVLTAFACLMAQVADGQSTLSSYDASGNFVSRSVENLIPPQITRQPFRQIVARGEVASFSVVLLDASETVFQWRFDSSGIAGATNDSLVLPHVDFPNEGLYTVVVANSSGSVTSSPAPLMIDSLGGGMPDSWQELFFGNFDQNPSGDFDGDGVSNLEEFLEGTDPTNPKSFRPRLHIQGTQYGQITASPNSLSYDFGQYVTLTAVPDSGATFTGWSGSVTGTKDQVSVLMNGHKFVAGSFTQPVAVPVFRSVAWGASNVRLSSSS